MKTLPKDHVGKKICRSCLDGNGITVNCPSCGKEFQSEVYNPNAKKKAPDCPACRRKHPNNPFLNGETPPPEGKEITGAQRELASRMLARKYLWAFVLRFDPNYKLGWFHRDLSSRLEEFMRQVERGESPRLMIQVPPRHGKSRLSSQEFSSWILGHHPEWEIIAASYAVSLPVDFSRVIRERLRDAAYQVVFPSTALSPDSQSVESWRTTKGGGFLAAGVGGPITGKGANCFPAGTKVSTHAGPIQIEMLQPHMRVSTIDLDSGRIFESQIEAVNVRHSEEPLVEITSASGQLVRATPDHCFYVPGVGWIEARHLCSRDPILLVGNSDSLPAVQNASDASAFGDSKSNSERTKSHHLFDELHGAGTEEEVSYVRQTASGQPMQRGEVLLQSVQAQAQEFADQGLPALSERVSAGVDPDAILFAELCQRGSFRSDAGSAELSLRRWQELRSLVRFDAPVDSGTRQWLRDLPKARKAGDSPHQPRSNGQSSRQLDSDVHYAPCDTSQIFLDSVSAIRSVGDSGERVYDIQVEGTHCFFAESLLVHNCFIIDDPVKNAEEAESQAMRNNVWNWYTSTAYTRLAPGAGVLVIQTRWHSDDLSGRIEHQMRNEGGEHWEIVRYPAEAVENEKFRKKGEALHPERYDETALARIKKAVGPRVWNALYQQNPVPDEGAYFTKSMLKFYDTPPELLEVYNTWDLAIGQKQQNDWTVGLQWGVDKDDNIYVLNLLRARMDALQIVEAILDMWVAHPNTQACGIEEGQIKLTMGPMLEKRVAERRLFNFHQIPLKPGRQDKVARARTIQGRMQQGRVFFPKIENAPWMEKLIDEMLAFPFGKNDDQVDTLGYCGLMAAEVTPPTIDTAFKNADVGWKAKLQGFVANGRKVKSWLEA